MAVCAAHDIKVKIRPCPIGSLQKLTSEALPDGEVHIWNLSTPLQQVVLDQLSGLLSPDELQRAARFRFPRDANQFISSRGLLRTLLASYLARDPRSLRFHYSEKGKPELPSALSAGLCFNVAHSGDIILWAFTRSRRLGVDVEQVRKDFSTAEIAERFFSVGERAQLRALPAVRRHEAFFQCWTRKEAYLKATGDGLSLPLDQFDVTLAPGQPAHLLQTRPDPAEAERWLMRSLDVGPDYAAALVVERQNPSER